LKSTDNNCDGKLERVELFSMEMDENVAIMRDLARRIAIRRVRDY
jgi:hypothetical protein